MKLGRLPIMIALMVMLGACSRFQIEDYIKGGEKTYTRQMQADIEHVYDAVKTVVERHGWKVDKVEDPATYERNEYTERVNQKRFLLMTDIKEVSSIVDANYVHLNIYLYQVNQWTDIEVRYEAVRSMVKEFHRYRNDRVVNAIIDEIEKEIGG